MSTGRKYSISKAERFANHIIADAESKKKSYLDKAYEAAEKEIELYEQASKEEHNKQRYDLTKEQKELEDGKVTELEKVRREYEDNNKRGVDFLIDNITAVNVKIQRNIIGDFEGLKVGR